MMKFYNDIKYACRMLHRAPGFTILVMGILAIGIAANTSLFSVVNAVILRSLPYCNSDRLVIFEEEGSSWGKGFSGSGELCLSKRKQRRPLTRLPGIATANSMSKELRVLRTYASMKLRPIYFRCLASNLSWDIPFPQ